MGKTKQFVDWNPGEVRVKLQIVLPSGATLNYYITHLPEAAGKIAAELGAKLSAMEPISGGGEPNNG